MEDNPAYSSSRAQLNNQVTAGNVYELVHTTSRVSETTVPVQEKNKAWQILLCVFIAVACIAAIFALVLALASVVFTFSLNQQIQNTYGLLQRQQELLQDVNITLSNDLRFSGTIFNPARSCKGIAQLSPSGEYWIQTSRSSSPVQVYCDTNSRSCSCNTSGGWTRVANLDMTDPSQQCPDGFKLVNRTTAPFRTCGRPESLIGCVSTTFPVYGIEYSHVCGRIIGYQVGSPSAFRAYRNGVQTTIDGYYISGVSLTHGQNPREHIWSFANAVSESNTNDLISLCPCIRNGGSFSVPPFIGEDYFCDTAIRGNSWTDGQFFPEDPLWDGKGCGNNSTCCSFNNPPWFCKQLLQPTTDNIELRICENSLASIDDTPVEAIEIYIQ